MDRREKLRVKIAKRTARIKRATLVGGAAAILLAGTTFAVGASAASKQTVVKAAVAPLAAAVPSFPDASTTGVPAGTVLQTASHSSTACTNCPPGVIWDTTRGYNVRSCTATGGSQVVVDGWKFNDGFGLAAAASNGTHAQTGVETTARAAACVVLTRSLVAPATGSNGQCGICTGYTGGGSSYNCTTPPCGPIFVADVEVSMPQSPTGFSYAADDTNLHMWRVYLHGTIQGADSDGYSEVHDSLLVSDRVDAACVQSTGKNCAHGDALFEDGGPPGSWWIATHNTFQIAANPANYCSADVGFYGDNNQPNGITFINNLFKQTNGLCYYCLYTGASQPLKTFKTGANIVLRDNVFEKGANGKCGDAGPVADWATGNGNVSCNNKFDDGTVALADTAGCSSPTSTTTTITVAPTTSTSRASTTTSTPTTVPASTTTVTQPAPTSTTTTTELVIPFRGGCYPNRTPPTCTLIPS